MNAFNIGYITGIIAVFAFSFIIRKYFSKRYPKPIYDERQTLARLKAYQYAFFTAMGYLVVMGVVLEPVGIGFADTLTFSTIGIFISATVLAVICIFNECYFAINQNPKKYIFLFVFVIAINVVCFIINLNGQSIFTDGKLNYRVTNLAAAIMIAVILIALLIKANMRTKEDEE